MISVIIPYHNSQDTIKDTLASLNWQTYKDFEVILVDDGSESGLTYDDIGEHGFREQIIRLPKNKGAGAARNAGIQIAKGDLIFPLDADDILIPTALERLKSKVGQVVYCNYVLFGNEHYIINSGEFESQRLKAGNFIINSSLFPRSLWEQVKNKNGTGYDEEIPAWEDWLFWLEAEKLGATFTHLPEWLIMVRKRTNGRDVYSLSQRDELRKYIEAKWPHLLGQH